MKRILRLVLVSGILMALTTACKKTDSPQSQAETQKTSTAQSAFDMQSVIEGYLTLKEALYEGKGDVAAQKGKALMDIFIAQKEAGNVPKEKKGNFGDLMDDAIENTEHISKNADHLEHQRFHLSFLSQDLDGLIAIFGTPVKLYKDFCPDYNDGKGAYWFSSQEDIQNPYLGEAGNNCGEIQQEF